MDVGEDVLTGERNWLETQKKNSFSFGCFIHCVSHKLNYFSWNAVKDNAGKISIHM